jgi:hypothetical protein
MIRVHMFNDDIYVFSFSAISFMVFTLGKGVYNLYIVHCTVYKWEWREEG